MSTSAYLQSLLPLLLKGAQNTLLVFVITLAAGLPFGLVITMCSLSKFPPLRWFANFYIWLFRGTPLMLQLFFMYFFIPIITKQWIMLSNMSTAAITFVLNYAAYFAEIYRGGIQSIDRGQHEAAKTLGFTKWQTMRHIIIPQTVRRVIPSLANESITLVKDTALISVIGAHDVLRYAKEMVNRTANPMAYGVVAVFYLALTYGLTMVAMWLERSFSRHENH